MTAIRNRMDRAYTDRLDGKIPDFWERKMVDWRMEEQQVEMAIEGLNTAETGTGPCTLTRKHFDVIFKRAKLEEKIGRGGGIRTPDPLVPNQMRYQTALRPDSY